MDTSEQFTWTCESVPALMLPIGQLGSCRTSLSGQLSVVDFPASLIVEEAGRLVGLKVKIRYLYVSSNYSVKCVNSTLACIIDCTVKSSAIMN